MEITSGSFVILIPVIVALVGIAKNLGLKTKYAPVVGVILGVIGVCGLEGSSFVNALSGIVAGLSALGLYSGAKTTVKG